MTNTPTTPAERKNNRARLASYRFNNVTGTQYSQYQQFHTRSVANFDPVAFSQYNAMRSQEFAKEFAKNLRQYYNELTTTPNKVNKLRQWNIRNTGLYCAELSDKIFDQTVTGTGFSEYRGVTNCSNRNSCTAVARDLYNRCQSCCVEGGYTGNIRDKIKELQNENPYGCYLAIVGSQGNVSGSGLHQVMIAPTLDANNNFVMGSDGKPKMSVYSFNNESIKPLDNYNRSGTIYNLCNFAGDNALRQVENGTLTLEQINLYVERKAGRPLDIPQSLGLETTSHATTLNNNIYINTNIRTKGIPQNTNQGVTAMINPENKDNFFNTLADIKQNNPALYIFITTAQHNFQNSSIDIIDKDMQERLNQLPMPQKPQNGYKWLGRTRDLQDIQKLYNASPEFCQGWARFRDGNIPVSDQLEFNKLGYTKYVSGLMIDADKTMHPEYYNISNTDEITHPNNTTEQQTLTNDGNTPTTEPTAAVAANTVSDADKAKMVSMIEGMNKINGPSKSIDANQTVDKLVDLYGDKSHDLLLKALMEPTNYSNISGKSEINTSRAAIQDLISVDKEHANEYANKILGIETPANTAVQGNEALTNASDPQKFGKDIASFAEIAGKSPELFNALSGIIRAMPEDDPTAQYLSMILTAVSAMKENNALTELPISQQLGQQDMLNQLHTSNPELFGSLQNMLGNIPSPSDQYANAGSILTTMNSIAPVSDNSFTQSLTATIANDGATPAANDGATPAANEEPARDNEEESWIVRQFRDFQKGQLRNRNANILENNPANIASRTISDVLGGESLGTILSNGMAGANSLVGLGQKLGIFDETTEQDVESDVNWLKGILGEDKKKSALKVTMKNDRANVQAIVNSMEQNGIETQVATRTEIPRVRHNGFMYTIDRSNGGRS